MPLKWTRRIGTISAWSRLSVLVVIFVMTVTEPARVCIGLWNAPDNSAVRAAVAGGGYRHAALTAYTAEGEPGRVCYMTVLDGAGKSRGSFVIWPDNLFDNGALHDYSGPFVEDEGYLSHPLNRDPNLAVSDDGRIQTV
jgi:hypothetical protein